VQEVTDFASFYIPTNSDGYEGYCQNFTVESNVTGYAMTEIGGTMMLYGTNAEQGLWLGIRSGKTVDEKVALPLTTVEIFQYAMANTTSETGKYTVNWEELTKCFALDDGAFLSFRSCGRSEALWRQSVLSAY